MINIFTNFISRSFCLYIVCNGEPVPKKTNNMRLFYSFLALGTAQTDNYHLVCDFGEDCNAFCETDFCEYRWTLSHRHSMSWRTWDSAKGKTLGKGVSFLG